MSSKPSGSTSPADEFEQRWTYSNPAWPWTSSSGLDSITEAAGRAQVTASLNLGAVLTLADDAPERNPRSGGSEVQSLMYRDLQRLGRRVNRLEQLS